jgi:hypothetical protein
MRIAYDVLASALGAQAADRLVAESRELARAREQSGSSLSYARHRRRSMRPPPTTGRGRGQIDDVIEGQAADAWGRRCAVPTPPAPRL